MSHKRKRYSVVRGDKLPGISATFKRTAFDFAGTVIKAELRDAPDGGTLLYTFVINIDTATVGQVTFVLEIPGTVTAGLAVNKDLFFDVQITGPGDFGPFTPGSFILRVTPDITA